MNWFCFVRVEEEEESSESDDEEEIAPSASFKKSGSEVSQPQSAYAKVIIFFSVFRELECFSTSIFFQSSTHADDDGSDSSIDWGSDSESSSSSSEEEGQYQSIRERFLKR